MPKEIKNPHDQFFKSMMTDPKVIREFFEQNLPANIRNVMNFDVIVPERESYIEEHLRMQIADLVYSTEFNDKPGYLYILIEHQSSPCEILAFRLLKYMVAIMDKHMLTTSKNILPAVYPMTIYNGWKNYNYSTDIFDLFGDQKEFMQDILWKPYQLIDLSKIPDEKLKANLHYGIAAYTMKHIFEKNLIPILKNVLAEIKPIEKEFGMDSYIDKILSYFIEVGEINKQDFVNTVKTSLTTINEDKLMTLAEQFRQEGEQRGREEGIVFGLEKGIEKGKRDVAMNLFNNGMDISQIAKLTGLFAKDIEQLKNTKAN